MDIKIIIFAIVITLVEAVSQYYIRKENVIVGGTGYLILTGVLLYTYKNSEMSAVNIIWSAMTILNAVILGKYFYNETVDSNKLIAAGLAIVAVILASS